MKTILTATDMGHNSDRLTRADSYSDELLVLLPRGLVHHDGIKPANHVPIKNEGMSLGVLLSE